MKKPLVAITTDVHHSGLYDWFAVPDFYVRAAASIAGVTPILVPSLGPDYELGAVLDVCDGVLVTGSRSNVHPDNYSQTADERYEPYDRERDATTLPFIRATVELGLPLLAICRGLQELNVALGGSLVTEIQELPDRDDHRGHGENVEERFAIKHEVKFADDSKLSRICGSKAIMVNSVHRQAIDKLASGLRVEAFADDGTIEAVTVEDAANFTLGVQWHPEVLGNRDEPSRKIFEAFGEAVFSRRALRQISA